MIHGTGKIDAVSPYFVPGASSWAPLTPALCWCCCLARSPHSTAGTAAFSPAFSPGIDIVVMICVARWRAMLRGTPDAQRRLEEACRRECDEREQFLWQKSARGAVWGHFGAALPAGVAALYFSRAAGLALMGAACVPPSDKQSALALRFQTGIKRAPMVRHGPERRRTGAAWHQAAPLSFGKGGGLIRPCKAIAGKRPTRIEFCFVRFAPC